MEDRSTRRAGTGPAYFASWDLAGHPQVAEMTDSGEAWRLVYELGYLAWLAITSEESDPIDAIMQRGRSA